MLQKITVQCQYEGIEAQPQLGVAVHGVLMDALPGEVAEALHEDGLNRTLSMCGYGEGSWNGHRLWDVTLRRT